MRSSWCERGQVERITYFDFGLSLLADTSIDFPLGGDIYEMINKIHAKPFDRDFDVQLDAAQDLYGNHLKLHFTNQDIEQAFGEIGEYYSGEIITRAKELLYHQKHKYPYMFVK